MTEAESQGKPKNSKYMIKLKACVFLKVLYSFELLITFFFWMLGTAIQNKRKIGSYRILSFHELLWLETCRIPDLWPYLLQNKSPGWSKKKKQKISSQEKNEAKENRQASCWDKHYEKVWIQARMIVKYNIWKKILHSDGIDSNFRQKINANSMS